MNINLPQKRKVLAATVAAMALCSTAAMAQSVFDGSKARVNLSNKLQMLTQEISSASCRATAGIGAVEARAQLAAARNDFNNILNGLENGGMQLGIPNAEKFSIVLKDIADVREKWEPLDAAVQDILDGGDTAVAATIIAEGNLDLLNATDVLIANVTGKYANPNELTMVDAMALKIAGRQRMLGHRLTKEVCGIVTGSSTLGTPEALGATIDTYNVSLSALIEGMPNAGVNPPPTDAIAGELSEVQTTWAESLPALDSFRNGTRPSENNVQAMAAISTELMTDMSNIVTLYMLATPGQEDVYRVPLQSYAETELVKWLDNADLIAAIKAQNERHVPLTQELIDELDLTWRAERKADAQPLIDEVMGRPSSLYLKEKQDATAAFVTEVFAMDNKGLNVAQSAVTSDFWQGDESKWQETFGNGSGNMHISEVEFDDSTGTYQSQVSMPVYDPATGEMIGAITFGVNVQSLL